MSHNAVCPRTNIMSTRAHIIYSPTVFRGIIRMSSLEPTVKHVGGAASLTRRLGVYQLPAFAVLIGGSGSQGRFEVGASFGRRPTALLPHRGTDRQATAYWWSRRRHSRAPNFGRGRGGGFHRLVFVVMCSNRPAWIRVRLPWPTARPARRVEALSTRETSTAPARLPVS